MLEIILALGVTAPFVLVGLALSVKAVVTLIGNGKELGES